MDFFIVGSGIELRYMGKILKELIKDGRDTNIFFRKLQKDQMSKSHEEISKILLNNEPRLKIVIFGWDHRFLIEDSELVVNGQTIKCHKFDNFSFDFLCQYKNMCKYFLPLKNNINRFLFVLGSGFLDFKRNILFNNNNDLDLSEAQIFELFTSSYNWDRRWLYISSYFAKFLEQEDYILKNVQYRTFRKYLSTEFSESYRSWKFSKGKLDMPLGNVVTSDGMSICTYALVDMLILSLRYIRESHSQIDNVFKIEALGALSVPNKTKKEMYNYRNLVWELTLYLNELMGTGHEVNNQIQPSINVETSEVATDSDLDSCTAKSWDSISDYLLHDNLNIGAEAQEISPTSSRGIMTPSCFALNDLYCLESIKNYEQNTKASPYNSNKFKETLVNIPDEKDQLIKYPIKDQAEALLPQDFIEEKTLLDRSFSQKLKNSLDKFNKTSPISESVKPKYSFVPSRVRTDHSGKVIQSILTLKDPEPPVVWYIGDSTAANAFPEKFVDVDFYGVGVGSEPGGTFDSCINNIERIAREMQPLNDNVRKIILYMAINCDIIQKHPFFKWQVNPNLRQVINGLNWSKYKIENTFESLGIKNVTVIFTIPPVPDLKRYCSRSHKIVPTYDPNNQADLLLLNELDLLATALECVELVWEKQPSVVNVEIWNLQSVFNMNRTRKFIGAAAKEFDGIKNRPPFEFENSKWSYDGLHLNINAAKCIWDKLLKIIEK